MKKLSVLLVLLNLLFVSCAPIKISDESITVKEVFKIRRNYYYKYFYDCRQNGLRVRVYSNQEYKVGQVIKIQ